MGFQINFYSYYRVHTMLVVHRIDNKGKTIKKLPDPSAEWKRFVTVEDCRELLISCAGNLNKQYHFN